MHTYSEMFSSLKNVNLNETNDLSAFNDLKIAESGDLTSYYIPFDYVSPQAKVVLVGITPGKTQLINALKSVQDSLSQGLTEHDTLKKAKDEGAFSGGLRKNLVNLLDYIGLNAKLGIASTQSLFEENAHLVHTTSVLRHPVFIKGKDYSGSQPNMLKHPVMLEMMDIYLKNEINQLPEALYIPLGPKVAEVFKKLVKERRLTEEQVLFGLPHPSGANAERIAYFIEKKPKAFLSNRTNPDLLDNAKKEILEKLAERSF